MEIDTESINHNAVRLIKDLLESRYEIIEEVAPKRERRFLIMTLGEIG